MQDEFPWAADQRRLETFDVISALFIMCVYCCCCGDRTEKALVLEMIRAAISSNEEYYKQHDAQWVQDRPKTCPVLVNGDNGNGFLPQDQPGQDDGVERTFDR